MKAVPGAGRMLVLALRVWLSFAEWPRALACSAWIWEHSLQNGATESWIGKKIPPDTKVSV